MLLCISNYVEYNPMTTALAFSLIRITSASLTVPIPCYFVPPLALHLYVCNPATRSWTMLCLLNTCATHSFLLAFDSEISSRFTVVCLCYYVRITGCLNLVTFVSRTRSWGVASVHNVPDRVLQSTLCTHLLQRQHSFARY